MLLKKQKVDAIETLEIVVCSVDVIVTLVLHGLYDGINILMIQ